LKAADGWIEVGKLDAIPRLGARVVHTTPQGDFAISGPPTTTYLRCASLSSQGGPLSQGIVYGKKVDALHNWASTWIAAKRLRPDEGCTSGSGQSDRWADYLSLNTKQAC